MRLFKRQREKAFTGDGGVSGAVQNGWSAFPMLGPGARDRILRIYNVAQGASYGWLYSKSPALRMVVDKVAKDVAALELRLYEEVSESERQPAPDHPAALSLRYPNETTPSDQLVRGLVKDWLIHDNSYALLAPTGGRRLWIQRIPAFMVEVQGSSLFFTGNYRVWPQGAWTTAGAWGGAGTWQDFTPEQIFHWHGEHPQDLRVGLSRLDTLRGVIAEDAALQQAIVELANAGLQEPMWVYRPLEAPQWSNPAREGFEEDLTNRLRGRNSKPVVMEEGMEMRSFGVTPHDAEMMALRKWAVAQIAGEYDMPLAKVGLEVVSQEAEDDYNKDVIWPTCKAFASMLDHRILVGAYDWTEGCFAFNLDERLMGNARIQTLVSATGRPVMLTNEARAKLNLPPVKDGDELVTPLNVIVGEKPSPQVMPAQDPNKPPQDGSYRQDQPGTPIPSENDGKTVAAEAKAVELPAGENPSDRLPQLHPGFAGDLDRQRKNIETAQAVTQALFDRIGRVAAAKAVISNRDWQRWEREFAGDLDKTLHGIVAAEGTIYSMKLAGDPFDMGQVTNYLRATSEGAASALLDTVKAEIADMGVDDALAHAPQHVASFGTSLGGRGTMWARLEAAKQAPGYEGRIKTWIADTGRHAELNGQTAPASDDWPAGFGPGQEPGCACSLTVS